MAIASYGEKNLGFLHQVIATYQAMAMSVDVVVISEAPKSLPPEVRVAVGLPSRNPWSLPFAHKKLFAENLDRYDLFIYSEDDIGVTERNVRGFLSATDVLEPDEIAGFLRYEKDSIGSIWMPDAHWMFHWDPSSLVVRGDQIFASYTNEHAACYMVTQAQLRRAIASGGFLREPYEGKYDMLCAAATDLYTSCGFRKMICISDLQEFMVHHMSDRYAGQMGLPWSSFQAEVETLREILSGSHPATTLCEVESRVDRAMWSKSFYERPHDTLLAMVPDGVKSVLSIGCGSGATETELTRRGADVTALPLNSVIGATAASSGIKLVYGDLDECLRRLEGHTYDCVLITNLLHLNPAPSALFNRCAALAGVGGTVVVESPNFDRLPTWVRRSLRIGTYKKLRSFAESGISVFGPGELARLARAAGFSDTQVRWYDHAAPSAVAATGVRVRLGRLTAKSWVFRAVCRAGVPASEAQAAPRGVSLSRKTPASSPRRNPPGLAEQHDNVTTKSTATAPKQMS